MEQIKVNNEASGLDLKFFYFIHKRSPRNQEEFESFRKKLDERENKDAIEYISEVSFYEMFTATRGKKNPFLETQKEYNGGYGEDEL
jgi:hypothetical protein